jgi:predicted RNA-binding protein with PIN domain
MPPLYLIDGYNFLHAVVLKGRERAAWWSPENQARAVSCIAALVAGEAVETWVVFDRRGPAQAEAGSVLGPAFVEAEGGLQLHHAPDADDYIVSRCAELSALREVIVVSADRSLVDRARYRGAGRLSPWAFARADARAAAVDSRARGSAK